MGSVAPFRVNLQARAARAEAENGAAGWTAFRLSRLGWLIALRIHLYLAADRTGRRVRDTATGRRLIAQKLWQYREVCDIFGVAWRPRPGFDALVDPRR